MCSNTPHSHTCTPWPMADCSFPHHKPPESYQACGLIHRKPLSCKRFVSFTDGFCTARTCPAPHHETNVLHSIHSPVHFHLRQHHDCDVEITVFDCIGLQQARACSSSKCSDDSGAMPTNTVISTSQSWCCLSEEWECRFIRCWA